MQFSDFIRRFWASQKVRLLFVAISFMTAVSVVWLGYEFWRLLWQQGRWGAIDLRTYHRLIRDWFAGQPIYLDEKTAVHPPASYAILWPLLGWLNFTAARWLWAITSVAALGWLIRLTVRESGADSFPERIFVVLLPLSMYATGATIGNGQLTIHLLSPLLAALTLLYRGRRGWSKDILVAAMLLFTLVKPSNSIPFFSLLLFASGGLRIIGLVSFGYVITTLFAASFQTADLYTLLHEWLIQISSMRMGRGESNLHAWLTALGLKQWTLPTSLLVLVIHGLWIYRYRRADFWLLLGVTAIITRLWSYHRWYDDLLILLPMVTLFRICKFESSLEANRLIAGVLLAVTLLAMLAPGGLYLLPLPWNKIYTAAQAVIWIGLLVFLVNYARHQAAADICSISERMQPEGILK